MIYWSNEQAFVFALFIVFFFSNESMAMCVCVCLFLWQTHTTIGWHIAHLRHCATVYIANLHTHTLVSLEKVSHVTPHTCLSRCDSPPILSVCVCLVFICCLKCLCVIASERSFLFSFVYCDDCPWLEVLEVYIYPVFAVVVLSSAAARMFVFPPPTPPPFHIHITGPIYIGDVCTHARTHTRGLVHESLNKCCTRREWKLFSTFSN